MTPCYETRKNMDRVTVAICTWNRAKLLDQTLARMHELRVPSDVEWELLVVNNNCTDDTDAVIARHQGALPIRRLFEPRQGLSNARNCAVAAARGNLLIWTDDDVLVEPQWLAAYIEAAGRWPEAVYCGGAIEPWFEITPPRWISENVNCLKAMLLKADLGSEERYYSGTEMPAGANMGFRTEVLKTYRFDTNLGRTGNDNISGEDNAVIDALRSRGLRGVWIPCARVKHFVTKQRLTRHYLWAFYYGCGRSSVRLEGIPQIGRRWGGVPRWLIRQAVESWLLAQWKRLWSRTGWVSTYLNAAVAWGMIAEFRHLAGSGRSVNAENRQLDGSL